MDPGEFYPYPDPSCEKKPDPNLEKNPDPDPTFEKKLDIEIKVNYIGILNLDVQTGSDKILRIGSDHIFKTGSDLIMKTGTGSE